MRTGWDPNEPALTPAAVRSGSFGQIFSTAVNGSVFGQPLVVGTDRLGSHSLLVPITGTGAG